MVERTQIATTGGALVVENEHGVWTLVAMRRDGLAAASVAWSEGSRVGLDDLVAGIVAADLHGTAQAVQMRRGTIGLYPPGSTPAFVPAGGLRVLFANASGHRVRWDGTLGHLAVGDLQTQLKAAQRSLGRS